MVLKSKDGVSPQLAALDELLHLPITASQRMAIEREKAILKAGSRGEDNAAFEIDFRWRDSPNWFVIHDLRLDYRDRVAQIDHLVFSCMWEFYVVETKGIRTKIKIEKGAWSYLQGSHWKGMANPIEQNSRHIQVLKQILDDLDWLPRRLGIRVVPRFVNVVLVPPDCQLHQEQELAWVVHMDEFVTKARRDIHLGYALANCLQSAATEEARILAQKLLALHSPLQPDYRKRFGIPPTDAQRESGRDRPSGSVCQSCGGPLSRAEASFCCLKKALFKGRLLCRGCQQSPTQPRQLNQRPSPGVLPSLQPEVPRCARCAVDVEAKVVRFCLERSERFGGKVLCRSCQREVR